MALQAEQVAHQELVGGGQTTKHSHAGGGFQFPVGAIYIETTGANPATTFGYGTWVQKAQGKFLVGIGADVDFDTIGESGGAKTHTHADHPAAATSQASADMDKKGTAAATVTVQAHTHQTPVLGHDSPSHLSPYEVIGYIWERTA